MTWDLHDFRIVTASAYPGMMAPLTGHPTCVCVLSGDSDGALATRQVAAQSLEAIDGVRRRWRFGDVARLADFVPKVLAEAGPDRRPLLLVPPRVSPAWEEAARAWPEVRLVGRPASEVAQIAEDKIWVRDELRALGVSVPQSQVVPTGGLDFTTLTRRLGAPFIVQAPSGAGGQGTFLIAQPSDLDACVLSSPHVDRWLVSRYAGAVTINVAAVVHEDGVMPLPASVQSSGIAELGSGFGAYCGSDFGAVRALPPRVLDDAYRQSELIGRWLHRLGHRGIFGADIAVDGEEIAFLELNPRIQGSSWLLSLLQQRQGQTPCLYQHVQALLGQPLAEVDSNPPVLHETGSHLLLRWTGEQGLVRWTPTPGVFRTLDDTEVTLSGLPAPGTLLLPGAIMARLESRASLAADTGRSLLPQVRQFVTALSDTFDVVSLLPAR